MNFRTIAFGALLVFTSVLAKAQKPEQDVLPHATIKAVLDALDTDGNLILSKFELPLEVHGLPKSALLPEDALQTDTLMKYMLLDEAWIDLENQWPIAQTIAEAMDRNSNNRIEKEEIDISPALLAEIANDYGNVVTGFDMINAFAYGKLKFARKLVYITSN